LVTWGHLGQGRTVKVTTNYALAGVEAAEKQNYVKWIAFGTFAGIVGPIFAHITKPEPPTDVLALGPKESADLQVFIPAYVSRAKSLRVRRAWTGFALAWVFWPGLFVACMPGPFNPLRGGGAVRQPALSAPIAASRPAATEGTAASARPPAVLENQRPAAVPGGEVEQSAADAVAEAQRRAFTEATTAAAEERRRRAEEAQRASEAEMREQIPVLTQAIEKLYDTIAAIHEEAATVHPDEWEQRWARDRATMARVTKEQVLGDIQARDGGVLGRRSLESVFSTVEGRHRQAEYDLTEAREYLEQAKAAAAAQADGAR
jgi:hypothetical protein